MKNHRKRSVGAYVATAWLLMKRAGFVLEDVLKLRLQQKSFWRILHERKNPETEKLRHEYCIIVRKGEAVRTTGRGPPLFHW